MENHEQIYKEFMVAFAKELPNKCKQLLMDAPETQLHRFHFSIGLDIRNRLFGDPKLMQAFVSIHCGNLADYISQQFLADLQRYLIEKK